LGAPSTPPPYRAPPLHLHSHQLSFQIPYPSFLKRPGVCCGDVRDEDLLSSCPRNHPLQPPQRPLPPPYRPPPLRLHSHQLSFQIPYPSFLKRPGVCCGDVRDEDLLSSCPRNHPLQRPQRPLPPPCRLPPFLLYSHQLDFQIPKTRFLKRLGVCCREVRDEDLLSSCPRNYPLQPPQCPLPPPYRLPPLRLHSHQFALQRPKTRFLKRLGVCRREMRDQDLDLGGFVEEVGC